ncbi:MAG: hypothetical protein ACE5GY_08300 [Thermodesulfobacteriota bacterium]
MIKINSAIGQDLLTSDRKQSAPSGTTEESTRAPGSEVVAISDEGKRKHIMGQLMASLSGVEGAKKDFNR